MGVIFGCGEKNQDFVDREPQYIFSSILYTKPSENNQLYFMCAHNWFQLVFNYLGLKCWIYSSSKLK